MATGSASHASYAHVFWLCFRFLPRGYCPVVLGGGTLAPIAALPLTRPFPRARVLDETQKAAGGPAACVCVATRAFGLPAEPLSRKFSQSAGRLS